MNTVTDNFVINRNRMIDEQIIARGIKNPQVIEAMRKVPRHLFVDEPLSHKAYSDHPLPIEQEQTISQPYIVALMTEYLGVEKTHKVLEIGTGSGYQTAVLANLANIVYTIERISELSIKARKTLNRLGYKNIRYKIDDGALGWKEFAPYDRIIVTAASEFMPIDLQKQLTPNGKIIIPIGKNSSQVLTLGVNNGTRLIQRTISECTFVPLVSNK